MNMEPKNWWFPKGISSCRGPPFPGSPIFHGKWVSYSVQQLHDSQEWSKPPDGIRSSQWSTTRRWWLKSGDHQLRLVVSPIIYRFWFYIPGGCLGFLPQNNSRVREFADLVVDLLAINSCWFAWKTYERAGHLGKFRLSRPITCLATHHWITHIHKNPALKSIQTPEIINLW